MKFKEEGRTKEETKRFKYGNQEEEGGLVERLGSGVCCFGVTIASFWIAVVLALAGSNLLSVFYFFLHFGMISINRFGRKAAMERDRR